MNKGVHSTSERSSVANVLHTMDSVKHHCKVNLNGALIVCRSVYPSVCRSSSWKQNEYLSYSYFWKQPPSDNNERHWTAIVFRTLTASLIWNKDNKTLCPYRRRGVMSSIYISLIIDTTHTMNSILTPLCNCRSKAGHVCWPGYLSSVCLPFLWEANENLSC